MVDRAVPGVALTAAMWLVPAPLPVGAVHLLVAGDERITVVDTGYGGHIASVIGPHLASRHRRLSDIDQIVTTHVHLDHAGGHAELLRHAPARVVAHAADAAAATDAATFMDSAWEMAGALEDLGLHELAAARRALVREHWSGAFPVHRLLTDGDDLSIGGAAAVAIHTPGHTPGSVSLFFDQYGLVVTGDAVQRWGIGPGGWPLVTDPRAYLASLDRIAGLGAEAMVMAHPFRGAADDGDPVRQGGQVTAALRDSRAFIEAVLGVARSVHPRRSTSPAAVRAVISGVDGALGRPSAPPAPFAWVTARACLTATASEEG